MAVGQSAVDQIHGEMHPDEAAGQLGAPLSVTAPTNGSPAVNIGGLDLRRRG
jgi:hypothetical protein